MHDLLAQSIFSSQSSAGCVDKAIGYEVPAAGFNPMFVCDLFAIDATILLKVQHVVNNSFAITSNFLQACTLAVLNLLQTSDCREKLLATLLQTEIAIWDNVTEWQHFIN
ncbi:hypothetical protein AVEN_74716-1 [Araneus ventricosus]|uniref:Uncharacterized protein n=1 Tax=Araneus ventricosus TaxID=182803 RepID=A0A4Y2WEU0_ARAVE|nr:hypothetical protein AVEN_74716-1 [Araneus ventricosus]